jgi:hypothetical protein
MRFRIFVFPGEDAFSKGNTNFLQIQVCTLFDFVFRSDFIDEFPTTEISDFHHHFRDQDNNEILVVMSYNQFFFALGV